MKPVLRYFGGKALLAKKIVALMPKHDIYLEPYGGAGTMLLNKPPCETEIYNDIDDNIVNLFHVLRHEVLTNKLIEQLLMTPFSRTEFNTAYQASDDPVESARRLIVRSFQGYSADATTGGTSGFRVDLSGSAIVTWQTVHQRLLRASVRLRQVVIENKPALKLIQSIQQRDNALIYLDPPYPTSTWNDLGNNTGYRHDMADSEHAALLNLILNSNAKIMISGYLNNLYADVLKNWHCVKFDTENMRHHPKSDCVWMNFNPQ
jgi:DNA adenine methylase